MRRLHQKMQLLVAIVLFISLCATGAQAVLKDFGPPNFAGYPSWYRDTSGVALQQCLSRSFSPISGLPICNLLAFPDTVPPFNPLLPATFPPNPATNYNWPLESFYFSATPDPIIFVSAVGTIKAEVALEATFGVANPVPGEQVTFTRVRAILVGVPSGSYVLTHPYGVEHLTVPNQGGGLGTLRFTRDVGATGVQFAGALSGDVGPWLRWTPGVGTDPEGIITVPATGEKFIGDFNVSHTFTGSPFGTNYFRIDGPAGSGIGAAGADFIETNLGMLEGQLYTVPIPSPLVVDRATYKRDAISAHVDVFATSTPAGNLTVSAAGSPGIPSTTMAKDALTGRFFLRYNSASPATLPSLLTVTNLADVPATVKDSSLVDEVTIAAAAFDVQTGTLTVVASSGDQLVPQALSAIGFGPLTAGSITVAGITVPPTSVTVASTGGGKGAATVTVVDSNSSPIAANDATSTNEITLVNIDVLSNDSDPNPGDTLILSSVQIASQPLNGTAVAKVNGTIDYTPNAGFKNSIDTFTYTVRDNHAALSNPATVSVTVNSVNTAPTATPQSLTTAEDVAAGITLTGSDADGTIVSFAVATQPAHGVVTTVDAAAGSFTYTPALNYNGADTFTFTATDNLGAVSTAVAVSLTITSVNDAPIANDDTAVTNLDAAKDITVLLNDTDIDNAINIASIVASVPAHGTAVPNVATGTVLYSPTAGYIGLDSFTYTVLDASGAVSNSATVTITVANTNTAPVANTDTARVNKNGGQITINVAANDSDADGTINPASVLIITDVNPLHGTTVNNNNGTIGFTPTAGYSGPASFTYTVNDNLTAVSNIATVNITVNAPPSANDDSAITNEDASVNISLLLNDTDPENNINPALVSITANPANGSVTLNAGVATYTPTANFFGSNSFTYTVADADGAVSNTATVTITVNSVNDIPVANVQSVTTAEDTATGITLTANDIDGTIASYAITVQPLHGQLTGAAPALTYTPALNYNGPDSFAFTATDNQGGISAAATVSITITAVNDAPVATTQSVTTTLNRAVAITLSGTDPDAGTVLTYANTNPTKGTLSGTSPNLTYTPNNGATGADSFTFTVNDGALTSPSATVNVTISGETINVSLAQFTVSTREWRIQGTSSIPGPGNTMTARTEAAGNAAIGTAQVDGNGNFVIRVRNSPVPFNSTIRLDSSVGGSRTGVGTTQK